MSFQKLSTPLGVNQVKITRKVLIRFYLSVKYSEEPNMRCANLTNAHGWIYHPETEGVKRCWEWTLINSGVFLKKRSKIKDQKVMSFQKLSTPPGYQPV